MSAFVLAAGLNETPMPPTLLLTILGLNGCRKSSPQCCGLVFITTVTDRIIGIALEQYVREVSAHPQIERIVQKEIGQEGADSSLNAKDNYCPGLG